MSLLVTLDNVSLAFGLAPLLDQVKLQINQGERVCLIGRNGAGKSSLLKVIEGEMLPDSGQIWRAPNLRIARLKQELPQNQSETIYEFVAGGLYEVGNLLASYHLLTQQIEKSHTASDLAKLENLQQKIEATGGWQFEQKIKVVLTKLNLDADKKMGELSGGWQRRAALAKALVTNPDLLLLDEPTNHLDLTAITWLETQLLDSGVALLFITHDRALLKRLATRILELDRGKLTSWPGDYENFLKQKEALLHAENKQHADFDKKLAQEEVWIRQGIKARRTRNEGRVRALEAMRNEYAARREVMGKADFSINEAQKSGKLIIEAQNISHSFNEKLLINNFSIRIMRGDKIGLIGPNGVGKSTLLNILVGEIKPDKGSVNLGTQLQLAYFDQLREALDPEKTVIDNVAGGKELIEVNGKSLHIISYLNQFLFSAERARTPVKALSGGECNRLLLARLFTKPANLLIMDEPTNDLDMETLELLEDLLLNYTGTLLLVSHDREFLDHVVTHTLVFEGNGKIQDYVGGYQASMMSAKPEKAPKTQPKKPTATRQKLSYKEQFELDHMPETIQKCEEEKNALTKQVSMPDFYKQSATEINKVLQQLSELDTKLEKLYARWEELENFKNN